MNKLYVSTEECMVLDLIRVGISEEEVINIMEQVDEEIEMGMSLINKLGDTYIIAADSVELIRTKYGLNFVPIRVNY